MEGMVGSSLHTRVLNEIGQSIVRGDLLPGDPLPNADDWSAAHGASRTVLREVIKVLAGKGMVESRPENRHLACVRAGTGIFSIRMCSCGATAAGPPPRTPVRFSSCAVRSSRRPVRWRPNAPPQQRSSICVDLLAEMERAGDDGARFAVPDLAFHQAILRMSGNELIGSLAALIETALVISFRLSDDNPQGQSHSLPLHQQVVESMANRDSAGASKALVSMLDGAEEDVRRALAARQR